MESLVWCPSCAEAVEPGNREKLVESEEYETSTIRDVRFNSVGYIDTPVQVTRRVSVDTCPQCGEELPDLGASTAGQYGRRRIGREHSGAIVWLGAAIAFSSCAGSCGGLTDNTGWQVFGVVLGLGAAGVYGALISSAVRRAPGSWPVVLMIVAALSAFFWRAVAGVSR